MSEKNYQSDIKSYKDIFIKMDELDEVLRGYIEDTVSATYNSAAENISEFVDEIIENRKAISEENNVLIPYSKMQSKLLSNTIQLIEQCKFENINLFQAFDQIKRNFIDKKEQYDFIISIGNKNLKGLDEVNDFLNKNINYNQMKFMLDIDKYINECNEILKDQDPSSLVKILSLINMDVFKTDFENFYSTYCTTLKNLESKCDELDIRSFRDFVSNDKKSLNEVLDLLSNFELSFISYPENDIMSIKAISKSIIDIGIETESEFNKIGKNDAVEVVKIRSMPIQTFKSSIEKNSLELISDEKTFMSFTVFVGDVVGKLDEIKGLIAKKLLENSKFELKSDVFSLSEMIRKKLHEIIKFVDDNSLENVTKKSYDIINGIKETVSIKCDNIEEHEKELKELYKEKCVSVTDDVFENIKNEIFKIRSGSEHIDIFEKVNRIDELLNADEIDKYIIVNESPLKSEIDTFKKNCVLQEISTFEQIINYSVNSLKTDENKLVIDFININESVDKEIFEILEKYNIIKICPEIKSIFDAKEQVVLTAEKTEGFKKGEIIKVVSLGFCENNEVLIKASVVCAV